MTKIQWRQDFKQLPVFDIDTVPEPLAKPIWHSMEGGNAEMMLLGKTVVVVKEGDIYRTNDETVAAQYRAKGKKVLAN